jgi:hypothetical protein
MAGIESACMFQKMLLFHIAWLGGKNGQKQHAHGPGVCNVVLYLPQCNLYNVEKFTHTNLVP